MLALVSVSTQAAWEELDQSTDDDGGSVRVDVDGSYAQTFTAGISGELSRVNLQLNQTTGVLTVEIRAVNGFGHPAAAALATATLSSALTSVTEFESVVFSPAPTIAAGTDYAIVLSTSGQWAWAASNSDSYANGSAFLCDKYDCWSDIGAVVGFDFAFQTYVRQADSTPPAGTVSVNNGDTYTNATTVNLTLTCQDDTSGCYEMQFSTDGTTFSTPVPFATTTSFTLPSGDGTKTVYAQFLDEADNQSTVVSDTIILDQTAPDTTMMSAPPATTNATGATFAFTGSDASGVSSYECAIDGPSFSACTSEVTHTGLSDGPHTFQVRAVDAAGNVDPDPATWTWTVDATAPTTIATVEGPQGQDGWYRSATVTLTADDPHATTAYTINSGVAQTYTAPFALSPDGIYAIDFSSIDTFDNPETTQSLTVKVDGTAPVLQPLGDQTLDPTSPAGAPVVFTPVVTDNLSSAGTIMASCVDQLNAPFVSGQVAPIGTTTITCTATDLAGNSVGESFSVTVLGIDELFDALRTQVNTLNILSSIKRSLLNQLATAELLAEMRQPRLSCMQLQVFDVSVRMQELFRQVSVKDATAIYTRTGVLRLLLGCGGVR